MLRQFPLGALGNEHGRGPPCLSRQGSSASDSAKKTCMSLPRASTMLSSSKRHTAPSFLQDPTPRLVGLPRRAQRLLVDKGLKTPRALHALRNKCRLRYLREPDGVGGAFGGSAVPPPRPTKPDGPTRDSRPVTVGSSYRRFPPYESQTPGRLWAEWGLPDGATLSLLFRSPLPPAARNVPFAAPSHELER